MKVKVRDFEAMKGIDYITETNTALSGVIEARIGGGEDIQGLEHMKVKVRDFEAMKGIDYITETNTALSGVIEARIYTQVKKSWALGIPTLLSRPINLLRCQRGGLDGVVA